MLINTSFNVKGEPIVETRLDAVRGFLTTDIDHLVLHDTISKMGLHGIVGSLVGVYIDMRHRHVEPQAGLRPPCHSVRQNTRLSGCDITIISKGVRRLFLPNRR